MVECLLTSAFVFTGGCLLICPLSPSRPTIPRCRSNEGRKKNPPVASRIRRIFTEWRIVFFLFGHFCFKKFRPFSGYFLLWKKKMTKKRKTQKIFTNLRGKFRHLGTPTPILISIYIYIFIFIETLRYYWLFVLWLLTYIFPTNCPSGTIWIFMIWWWVLFRNFGKKIPPPLPMHGSYLVTWRWCRFKTDPFSLTTKNFSGIRTIDIFSVSDFVSERVGTVT